jgi:glutamate-1-semialdehyde 2,1-aminomutase
MPSQEVEEIKQDIWQRYLERTRKSKELTEKAQKFLPGGDTRSIAFYTPYPFFAVKGQGCYLNDADGNEYLDFVNNMTSLIHGHAHPQIMDAIRRQTEKGITHGVPVEAQHKLAELICKRVPSIESIRFGNSGSEATMFCMRVARAFTGKQGFLKMDGGYHGSHDLVQVNTMPDMISEDLPQAKATRGVPVCTEKDIFLTPFNDLNTAERVLKDNRDKIAAIIMEPMLGAGGGVPPQEGYLQGMRALADQYGVLLIFDEVISFRVHEGGLQAMADVKPDLTAFGKIIGGGFPIGAFGGRKDIMEMFDPNKSDSITHSGTFSGNAVTMAAGIANLEIYPKKEVERINALGKRLTDGFNKAFEKVGIPGGTRGIGSLAAIAFTDKELSNSKDVILSMIPSFELMQYLHLEMLNQGVFFLHRGMFTVSTPMAETEIDICVEAFEQSLELLKPLAAEIQHQ